MQILYAGFHHSQEAANGQKGHRQSEEAPTTTQDARADRAGNFEPPDPRVAGWRTSSLPFPQISSRSVTWSSTSQMNTKLLQQLSGAEPNFDEFKLFSTKRKAGFSHEQSALHPFGRWWRRWHQTIPTNVCFGLVLILNNARYCVRDEPGRIRITIFKKNTTLSKSSLGLPFRMVHLRL